MVTMRTVLPLTIVAITMAIPSTAAAAPAKTMAEVTVHTGLAVVAPWLTEEDRPALWIGPCSPRKGVTSCRVVVRSHTTRCTAVARVHRNPDASWKFWLSKTRCDAKHDRATRRAGQR